MNTVSFGVLRALADGAFHSGTQLAQTLGVTRGTVWNSVRELESTGLAIYRVRGRGYRLAAPVSMLDRAAILSHAGAHAARFQVEICDVIDSTNTRLMQRAAAGAPSGTVLACELQLGGRGRMGRVWQSELAGALTFSVLWRFDQGASALAGLSLAVAVALVRALAKLGVTNVELKWPNDVLANGAKLAGILIEMQGDALGPSTVVIGIGLNVSLSPVTRANIGQPAADLSTLCDTVPDRSTVLGTVLAELAVVLDVFTEHGFAALRSEWMRVHAYQDEHVVITLPSGFTEQGIARGVAGDGALLVETGGAIRHVHSAEVQVRRSGSAELQARDKPARRPI